MSRMKIKNLLVAALVLFAGLNIVFADNETNETNATVTHWTITGAGNESETAGQLINFFVSNLWILIAVVVAVTVIFYVVRLVKGGR